MVSADDGPRRGTTLEAMTDGCLDRFSDDALNAALRDADQLGGLDQAVPRSAQHLDFVSSDHVDHS